MRVSVEDERVDLVVTPTAGAAGSSDIDSDIVDMAGFDTVAWYVPVGAVVSGAVTGCRAEQNSANSGSGMEGLEGTVKVIADDDDNKLLVIEVHQPTKRYVRLHIDRATQNATIGGVICRRYNAAKKPVTNDGATVHSVTAVISPAAV